MTLWVMYKLLLITKKAIVVSQHFEFLSIFVLVH